MAELTFRSPGVSIREIDLSGPSDVQPSGVPAAVVGTALRGPAFVPVTVATFQDFAAVFGNTDGSKFGPLAMREWLRNAGSGVYVRVLGAGDGEKRSSSDGFVTNAGFYVGEELPQGNGTLGANTYAVSGEPLGRTFFLGSFMSESAGSTVFSSAGIQASSAAVPIIRGVLMTPSGVMMTLGSDDANIDSSPYDASVGTYKGFTTGAVDISDGQSEFYVILNGHVGDSRYANVITASFDPRAPNYFSSVFNTDPSQLEAAGHYLYANYDIWPAEAVATGTGIFDTVNDRGEWAFVMTGSLARGAGSTSVPDYEEFRDRYRPAHSPYITSQKFGGNPVDLFRLVALDDGATSNTAFKVSITNIAKSRDEANQYGTFTLLVRDMYDTDTDPIVLERFSNLTLDPDSERYVARVIGDRHVFFDFDKPSSSQKLVVEGNYENQSQYVRVEMAPDVDAAVTDPTALPVGFRGHYHLVTSGSALLAAPAIAPVDVSVDVNVLQGATQPPVPMRYDLNVSSGLRRSVSNSFYWGVKFEATDDLTERNRSVLHDYTIDSMTRYFPNYHVSELNPWAGDNAGTPDAYGTILDSDRFCRNAFSLENVAVVTASASDVADYTLWVSASYVRDAATVSAPRRYLDVSKDFDSLGNRPFLKFTTFVQGGFDGTQTFVADKNEFTNNAVLREYDDTDQGGVNGPTIKAYRKALDILGASVNVDLQLLAIPGLRHSSVTDYAIDRVEARFDAMYIMDVPMYDSFGAVITGSLDDNSVSVTTTATQLTSRNLNTSFAAAYFPDVTMVDPTTRTSLVVPPTVAVLGALSLNDTVGHPWTAPAGFTRGALQSVEDTAVKLNRRNLDALQDADINPIVTFPGTSGPVVFGQKTLLQSQSSLDRVNVRRLLIDVRRKVRNVANQFVFEQGRSETLAKFSKVVTPILQNIQAQQGLQRFRVLIDTTTTTQADIENNTIRGQIRLQPTRALEFVSLDFVVTNAGALV